MSDYISFNDYKTSMRAYRLEQIIDNDNEVLDNAETTAIAVVKDALIGNYDVDTIFAQTGDSRHQNVLRWITCLVLYYIYERIPDAQVPERVIKNYNETMDMLDAIADGKRSVDLPRLLQEDGKPETKIRWGSDSRRTYW